MAVDGSGNVVITGSFRSPTISFGATTLTDASAVYADIFVVKLTPTGVWQWATSAGGSEYESGNRVAVDGSGNVVVTGYFQSPAISFGATTLTCAAAGYADIFVAKLTPLGVWQWATRAGGRSYDISYDVAVDGSGSVVVTGIFNSPTISFGATTLANAGETDIFVAKLTPTGTWQWATGVGSSADDEGNGVAVDGSGNVVITGSFRGPTISFGATTLTNANPGDADIFVAKLTPTGVWQWATRAGGISNDVGLGVAVDSSGSVVVTGIFEGPAGGSFGSTMLTSAGALDVFVAKLTPTGAWQWAIGAGGSGNDVGNGVAPDGSGGIVVTGWFFSPTITFGAITLAHPISGFDAIFLARLNGTTGLPETPADQPQLTLTPNPARTTVQLTGAPGPTATLFDALGRPVGTAPITPTGAATLDISALPAGLYLLRAGPATRRLVVE